MVGEVVLDVSTSAFDEWAGLVEPAAGTMWTGNPIETTGGRWSVAVRDGGNYGVRIWIPAGGGLAQEIEAFQLDAVAAHLWALAVEVGDIADLGECSECVGHGFANTWDPHAKRCQSCRGRGRDVRSLALLVCQAVGGPLASRITAVVTRAAHERTQARSALRAWAESKAEAREVVASARLDTRALDPMGKPWTAGLLGFVEPERTAGETLPVTVRRDALVADLARWLLAWLDGAKCAECSGTGDDPPLYWNGYEDPSCPDCWGTGSLGLRTPMEAALAEAASLRNTTDRK